MPNPADLRYASGYENNCLLNCGVHLIVKELLQAKTGSPLFAWVSSFNQQYGLNIDNIADLKKIFQHYTNPFEREIILGPVLRQHLRNTYLSDEEIRKHYFANSSGYSFSDLVHAYISAESDELANTVAYQNLGNLFANNQEFLQQLRRDYLADALRVSNFIEANSSRINEYWNLIGYKRYVEYITEIPQSRMLYADDAAPYYNRLGVMLEYFESTEQSDPQPILFDKSEMHHRLVVTNTGRHWDFYAQDIPASHNDSYTEANMRKAKLYFAETDYFSTRRAKIKSALQQVVPKQAAVTAPALASVTEKLQHGSKLNEIYEDSATLISMSSEADIDTNINFFKSMHVKLRELHREVQDSNSFIKDEINKFIKADANELLQETEDEDHALALALQEIEIMDYMRRTNS